MLLEPTYKAFVANTLDRVQNLLSRSDTHILSKDLLRKEQAAKDRAFAYVWVVAGVERFYTDAISRLIADLDARRLRPSLLRPSLFALVSDLELQALENVTGLKKWRRRVEAFSRTDSATAVTFNPKTLPSDGRTLRAEHLEILWDVFGLPGESLPMPSYRTVLTEFADGRNKVAHGELSPISFGRLKNTNDIRRHLKKLDEILLHVVYSVDEYLSRKMYYR